MCLVVAACKVEQPGSSRLGWLPEIEFLCSTAAKFHKRLSSPQLTSCPAVWSWCGSAANWSSQSHAAELAWVLQALLPEEDAGVGIHVGATVDVSVPHACALSPFKTCPCKHVLRPWIDGLYNCKLPHALTDEMKNDPRNSKVVKKTILKSGKVSVHAPQHVANALQW